MTDEEAARVRIGDTLETRIGGKWVQVVVEWVRRADEEHYTGFACRRPVRKSDGSKHHQIHRASPRVRLPLKLEPVPANVYADFLEENGHPEAAAALRAAFPLPPLEPGSPPPAECPVAGGGP